jgi:hypothetical protein
MLLLVQSVKVVQARTKEEMMAHAEHFSRFLPAEDHQHALLAIAQTIAERRSHDADIQASLLGVAHWLPKFAQQEDKALLASALYARVQGELVHPGRLAAINGRLHDGRRVRQNVEHGIQTLGNNFPQSLLDETKRRAQTDANFGRQIAQARQNVHGVLTEGADLVVADQADMNILDVIIVIIVIVMIIVDLVAGD